MDYPKFVKASELNGTCVKNLNNDPIGAISELIINKLSGEIHYVVVAFNETLGIKNKYFSFPWQSFKYFADGNFFTLNSDIDLIRSHIGFDKEQWPNFHAIDLEKYYQ